MELKFTIEGLDCANCAISLEEEISKINGIKSVSISFMTQKMIVEIEGDNKDKIMKDIKKVIKEEEPDVTITEN